MVLSSGVGHGSWAKRSLVMSQIKACNAMVYSGVSPELKTNLRWFQKVTCVECGFSYYFIEGI